MSLMFTESLYVRHITIDAGQMKVDGYKSFPLRKKDADGQPPGRVVKSRLPVRRGLRKGAESETGSETEGVVETRSWSLCKTLPLPRKYLVPSPGRYSLDQARPRWSFSNDWEEAEQMKPLALSTGISFFYVHD